MDLALINTLAQAVSAIGVIVSLVYLAIQVLSAAEDKH